MGQLGLHRGLRTKEGAHPEDVKSPGGIEARAGGQVEASLEQEGRTAGSTEGCGGLGWGRAGSGGDGGWARRWSWVGED